MFPAEELNRKNPNSLPDPACPRCLGLMILEWLFETGRAWRCVNCGAVVDPVIAENRRKCLAERKPLPSGLPSGR